LWTLLLTAPQSNIEASVIPADTGRAAHTGGIRLSTESGDLDRQIHYMKVFTEQIMPHFR